jgi:hypothetical protein
MELQLPDVLTVRDTGRWRAHRVKTEDAPTLVNGQLQGRRSTIDHRPSATVVIRRRLVE